METMSKHRASVGVMEINQKDAINARKSAYCEVLLAAGNTLLHNEPANVNDARQKPDWQKWKAAMQEELKLLERHGTYCNKTGRWPALFLTFPLPCGSLFITLHYSTLPCGGLFITFHYSTLLGTLFLTLLFMCWLYGGRW